MIPKLVTFDCAQTLVQVPDNWTLGQFVVDSAHHIGLNPPEGSAELYQKMYFQRIGEFLEINRSRDLDRAVQFWKDLAVDWFGATGLPTNSIEDLRLAADELGFGPDSILFQIYDDVIPCLDLLDSMGVRAAVVSNWDYSLHRVLRMFGIYERFVVVKASLEEGVEKPDPLLFEIALAAAGFSPEQTFHVGDSYEDDYIGAKAASIRTCLIDRNLSEPREGTIRSLLELPEAFAWTI
jgi:putative hydrolase of the HAD superfamily